MAQQPPDVPALDSPPTPEQGAPSTEFQRVLLPWADLNAQSPPAQWMELGKDLLPTIAVLAAMGPDQPHLLSTDENARLITSTTLSDADPLRAPVADGANQLTPTTPKLFPPGVSFYLGPADGNLLSALSGPYLVARNDAGVVTCLPVVTGSYEVGDIMLAVPTIAQAPAPAPSGGGASGFRRVNVLPLLDRPINDYTVDLPMGAAKGMILYYWNDGPGKVTLTGVFRVGPVHGLNQLVVSGPIIQPGFGYMVTIYPGLTAAANAFANDVLGQFARIIFDVSVSDAVFQADADLIP